VLNHGIEQKWGWFTSMLFLGRQSYSPSLQAALLPALLQAGE
jgi:hypothetical protein